MPCYADWRERRELKHLHICSGIILQMQDEKMDGKLEMISQALGHRNIETTMKYLNITEDELIEVSDAFL